MEGLLINVVPASHISVLREGGKGGLNIQCVGRGNHAIHEIKYMVHTTA